MKEKFLILTVMALLAVSLLMFFGPKEERRVNIEVGYTNSSSPFFRSFAYDFTKHFIDWWHQRGEEEFGRIGEPLYIGEESQLFVVYLKTDSGAKLIWQARIPVLQKEVDILARIAVSRTADFLREYFRQRYI